MMAAFINMIDSIIYSQASTATRIRPTIRAMNAQSVETFLYTQHIFIFLLRLCYISLDLKWMRVEKLPP